MCETDTERPRPDGLRRGRAEWTTTEIQHGSIGVSVRDPAAAAPSAVTRHASSAGGVAAAAESTDEHQTPAAASEQKEAQNKHAESGG